MLQLWKQHGSCRCNTLALSIFQPLLYRAPSSSNYFLSSSFYKAAGSVADHVTHIMRKKRFHCSCLRYKKIHVTEHTPQSKCKNNKKNFGFSGGFFPIKHIRFLGNYNLANLMFNGNAAILSTRLHKALCLPTNKAKSKSKIETSQQLVIFQSDDLCIQRDLLL